MGGVGILALGGLQLLDAGGGVLRQEARELGNVGVLRRVLVLGDLRGRVTFSGFGVINEDFIDVLRSFWEAEKLNKYFVWTEKYLVCVCMCVFFFFFFYH